MDKIELLLKELGNKVPKSVGLKLDEYYDLCDRLEVAEEELKENPTEENQSKFNENNEFVNSLNLKLVASLTELVKEKKEKEVEKPIEKPIEKPVETPAPVETPKEEKKGVSIFGIALGVVLLVGTAGAYNYFSKNK
jgi:hypothetical protein